MKNKVPIFCFGIIVGMFVGAFILIKFPSKVGLNNVELAKEKLEEFNRMEEICGKSNVRDKCKYGYCSSEIGLTCNYWRRAAFEAENKHE